MKTTAQMICDRFSKQGIPSKKSVSLKDHQLMGTFELNFKEDSHASNMDVAPEIKSNLSFKEREELDVISKQLNELKLPTTPPSAFQLYKQSKLSQSAVESSIDLSKLQDKSTSTQKVVRFDESRELADQILAKQWEHLSAAEKSQYEIEASSLYALYQKKYEEVNTLSD